MASESREISDARESEDDLFKSSEAEQFKHRGNEQFKLGSFLEAYDLYTEAIDRSPCPVKGDEIMKMKESYETERVEESRRRHIKQDEKRRMKKQAVTDGENNQSREENDEDPQEIPDAVDFSKPFTIAPQKFGENLAIYYCNRSACLLHLQRPEEAVVDCTVAVLLNPKYSKAFVRRSVAHEKLDKTDEALNDAKSALDIDPSNITLRRSVARLQKLEDERMEKLKAETMGKLKDLGNMFLGNFGLSTDNFSAVQDPSTGSYSIQFNQQPKT